MEITPHEPLIRLGAFLGLLLLLAAQRRWPARGDGRPARRQLVNFGLVAISVGILRFGFPVLAIGWAIAVHGGGVFGLLHGRSTAGCAGCSLSSHARSSNGNRPSPRHA
jgi:hypothetical protein